MALESAIPRSASTQSDGCGLEGSEHHRCPGEVVRSLGGDRRLKCGDRVDFKRAVHAGDLRRSVSAWKPAEL